MSLCLPLLPLPTGDSPTRPHGPQMSEIEAHPAAPQEACKGCQYVAAQALAGPSSLCMIPSTQKKLCSQDPHTHSRPGPCATVELSESGFSKKKKKDPLWGFL